MELGVKQLWVQWSYSELFSIFLSVPNLAQPKHHSGSRRAKTWFWNCSRSLRAGSELPSLQLLPSNGPDVMVCHSSCTFFSCHKATKHLCPGQGYPSLPGKPKLVCTDPRGKRFWESPQTLRLINLQHQQLSINSSWTKTCCHLFAKCTFPQSSNSGQKCSFDYVYTVLHTD